MKKIMAIVSLCFITLGAFTQDKMNKKMENKSDRMNKTMDNKTDKMNKKMTNDTGKMNKKTDTLIKRAVPRTRKVTT